MQTTANSTKRHQRQVRVRVARAAVAAATAAGATAVLLGATWVLALAWLAARARVDAAGPASADELITVAAATVAVCLAAWLAVGFALEVLSHAPGRVGRLAASWSERLTPVLARRMVAFVLGVGVGVVGGPSQAVAGVRSPVSSPTGTSSGSAGSAGSAGSSAVRESSADPGFVPSDPATSALPDPGFEAFAGPPMPADRPMVADPPPTPGFSPGPEQPVAPGFTPAAPRVRPQADPGLLGSRAGSGARSEVDDEVVVHRGDSLWSIAAERLGPGASDAEVARAWPRWFEANRDRVGDDPDVILPGQVLRVPGPDRTVSVPR